MKGLSIKGDFTIEEYLIEIGGKGKTTKQVQGQDKAFVLADDVIVGSLQTIPLYLFGLLY
ncbi:MAG: hypothetical protein FJZ58_07305 [Chlamydiae bacterium]|nr:hypothetical protein [Chlamydiota bacterium]